MKMVKYILGLFLFLSAGTAQADQHRVSILFVHYSVGSGIVEGYCWDSQYRRIITEVFDTLVVNVNTDTARIVFRSYRMNDDLAGYPLSDTCPSSSGSTVCDYDRFEGFRYDFLGGSYNRMRIWNSDLGGLEGNAYAGLVDQFFNRPGKQDSVFWKIFKTHDVPSTLPNPVTELDGYDLVIIKNPYACWFGMNQARSDSIKVLYQIVRDSIANHPEINVALAFGTPLRLGHEVSDSTQAKITYDLASWFASDNFFTHSNTGDYKNLWKVDLFRPLCEMTEGATNRYCLKTEYHVGDGASHLGNAGSSVAQDHLVAFIGNAVEDILLQRTQGVSREDIDRMIKDFRDGNASEQEVLDLIRQYNGEE